MKTVQRLSDADALRRVSMETGSINHLSDIQSNNNMAVSNGFISITSSDYFDLSHYVLEASFENEENPLVLTLPVNDVFEVDDENEIFVSSFSIYCDYTFTIEIKLYDKESNVDAAVNKSIQGGAWAGVRSNAMLVADVSEETDYELKITIAPIQTPGNIRPVIRISNINLINDQTWVANPVIQSMRPYIPGFYEHYDSTQTDPDYPFFRFVDVLTDAMSDVMYLYSDWFELEQRELVVDATKSDLSTKSRLTNYTAIRPENLAWISQFSGAKPKARINSSYPVSGELENFKQWQLNPAGYGRGAGTQAAIKEAARFVLSGTKSVVVGQRFDNNPWLISVTTLSSETPNIDARESVRVASTANINISSGLVNGSVVDGITVETGNRVLLKNQSTASQNGVYVVVASGAASRSTDFDESSEVVTGALFVVSEGSTNAGKSFELTTSGSITVDTTNLTFSEYMGSAEVYAAVEPARPLGYSIRHKLTDSFTLTLGDSIFGRLGYARL